MTSSTLPIPTASDVRDLGRAAPLADAAEEGVCDVCPHPSAGHDAIAARFCSATISGAFTRGCVCGS